MGLAAGRRGTAERRPHRRRRADPAAPVRAVPAGTRRRGRRAERTREARDPLATWPRRPAAPPSRGWRVDGRRRPAPTPYDGSTSSARSSGWSSAGCCRRRSSSGSRRGSGAREHRERASLPGGAQEPQPAGGLDRLGARVHAELAVDHPQVELQRVLGDEQLGRDLAEREPARQQPHHVALPAGQLLDQPGRQRGGARRSGARMPAQPVHPGRRDPPRRELDELEHRPAVRGDRLEHAVLGGELDGDLDGLGGGLVVDPSRDRLGQHQPVHDVVPCAARLGAARAASTASAFRSAARWILASQIGRQNASSV